jgi:hypothetical protein
VRCGKCATVFDAIAGLLGEREKSTQPEPTPQLALFEAPRRAAPAPTAPRPPSAPAPVPEFLEEEPAPRRSLGWALVAALGLLSLAAQAALHSRTELAVLFPEARPYLGAACELLGCELRLPRRPDLMAIEASELQADPRRENALALSAVIRNRAPFAQEYPALELTLTDERDQAVARRVLVPSDYLARTPPQLAEGIAPGAEAAVRLHLDASRVRAVGYRLYLFFP